MNGLNSRIKNRPFAKRRGGLSLGISARGGDAIPTDEGDRG